MQDPKKDIIKVIQTLCTTRDADELEETVMKYFVPDAKFSHPLCKANSRNEILGLFQWYRLASPNTQIHVPSVMYDAELNVLVVDVREKLDVWFIPLPSKEGRRDDCPAAVGEDEWISLYSVGGRPYTSYGRTLLSNRAVSVDDNAVSLQDQIGFLASPLLPLAAIYLRLGCLLSNLGACVFRTVGLNSGLRGGTVSYTGILEAAGLAKTPGNKVNGSARE
ncbi:hypothetical protein J3R82DRAFT_10697 [Butyriboletus roseoflavus]|nr:hypothetical protein J3R82DRAFT_10697 [Butyriboletus roseoflavus]